MHIQSVRKITVLCLLASALMVGCGKKEAEAPEAAAAPAPKAEKEQAADAGQAAAAAPAAVNVTKQISDADSALKANNYEAAADSLLKAQFAGQQMTPKQAVDHKNKMRDLQAKVAEGMMRGDPNARKAAMLLKSAKP